MALHSEEIPPRTGAEDGRGSQKGPRRSLSRTIARTVMLATAGVAIACVVLFAVAFYYAVDARAAGDLESECEAFASVLDGKGGDRQTTLALLRHDAAVVPADTRVTLIGEDGAVLFDNRADAAVLDNHAMRPEVIQAMETGEAGRAGIPKRCRRKRFITASACRKARFCVWPSPRQASGACCSR